MTTQNREAAVAALAAAFHDAQVHDWRGQGSLGTDATEWAEAIIERLPSHGYVIVPAAQDSDALRAALKRLVDVADDLETMEPNAVGDKGFSLVSPHDLAKLENAVEQARAALGEASDD